MLPQKENTGRGYRWVYRLAKKVQVPLSQVLPHLCENTLIQRAVMHNLAFDVMPSVRVSATLFSPDIKIACISVLLNSYYDMKQILD